MQFLKYLHTFLGQLCCLLWYKHSPAVLLPRAFCSTSSAASLVESSKHLPAVLFLCKAQKHLHKLLGLKFFYYSHSSNGTGILSDHLISFEDHLWKLSHTPLTPVHAQLLESQCLSTACSGGLSHCPGCVNCGYHQHLWPSLLSTGC